MKQKHLSIPMFGLAILSSCIGMSVENSNMTTARIDYECERPFPTDIFPVSVNAIFQNSAPDLEPKAYRIWASNVFTVTYPEFGDFSFWGATGIFAIEGFNDGCWLTINTHTLRFLEWSERKTLRSSQNGAQFSSELVQNFVNDVWTDEDLRQRFLNEAVIVETTQFEFEGEDVDLDIILFDGEPVFGGLAFRDGRLRRLQFMGK